MALTANTAWTLVPATLLALFALSSIATMMPGFFDPCHEWGMGADGREESLELDDECPSRSGTSQTKAEAVFGLVSIQGVLLLAAGAILVGAFRTDGTWTAAGASLLLALVPPFGLGIFWIPVLVLAIALFIGAAQMQRHVDPNRVEGRAAPFGVAALGIALVVAFFLTEEAVTLATMAGILGLIGIGLTAFVARRGARGTPDEPNA